MRKTRLITLAAALALILCACNGNGNDKSNTTEEIASPAADSQTSENDAELTTDQTASAQWPSEFEGVLPTPECTITEVTRYDENSTSGKLTVVAFSDMSKENAEIYVKNLKEMGFAGGAEIIGESNIAFSGFIGETDQQKGMTFTFDAPSGTGFISF